MDLALKLIDQLVEKKHIHSVTDIYKLSLRTIITIRNAWQKKSAQKYYLCH